MFKSYYMIIFSMTYEIYKFPLDKFNFNSPQQINKPKISMPLLSPCSISLNFWVLNTDILISPRFNN